MIAKYRIGRSAGARTDARLNTVGAALDRHGSVAVLRGRSEIDLATARALAESIGLALRV
ncbi:hypothetical protein [Amycolatopsis anabasis]|uniref:hypothetical protein n=1 Tax=Amycolatopsis anabasis TaxID=1840409 RepID=UPI00131D2210|nr:hypothetical protein [Amycolatopsis anabasis]